MHKKVCWCIRLQNRLNRSRLQNRTIPLNRVFFTTKMFPKQKCIFTVAFKSSLHNLALSRLTHTQSIDISGLNFAMKFTEIVFFLINRGQISRCMMVSDQRCHMCVTCLWGWRVGEGLGYEPTVFSLTKWNTAQALLHIAYRWGRGGSLVNGNPESQPGTYCAVVA